MQPIVSVFAACVDETRHLDSQPSSTEKRAVVVRFSRSRRRYERQGLLVEPPPLAEVQRELEAQGGE